MTDPGAAAALVRVEDLLDALAWVDLQVVVVAPPDATRQAARDRARGAAIAAGRGSLLDEAMAAARETTLRSFARAGFSGTWAATDMAASVLTARDRVAAAAALEEAAMAEVVEDLVDEETLDVLRASTDELDRSTGLPAPGALSSFARSSAVTSQGPLQVALLITFVMVGIGIWAVYGPGLGLLAVAVGVTTAGLVGRRNRPDA